MAEDKFDELIQKQLQREDRMKQVREDYIDEMGELPKKQITVKLFPNTHKSLKVIAATKDTTIEKIATAIIEDKISDLDIVKYVKMSFDNSEKIYEKLRVVSAIQDRSLDKIVGSIIEYEVGAENNIDTVKLMNEILESVEDKE